MVAVQLAQGLVQVLVQGELVQVLVQGELVLVQVWVVVEKENLKGQDHNRRSGVHKRNTFIKTSFSPSPTTMPLTTIPPTSLHPSAPTATITSN
jgi:hypothetical protein